MKTTTRLLAVAFTVCGLLAPPPSYGGRYEGPVWKGVITITYREKGEDKSKRLENDCHIEDEWSFSNTFRMTLNVCGNSLEQAYVKSTSVDYKHTSRNSGVHRESLCLDTKERKRPGWTYLSEGQFSALVHPVLVGFRANAGLLVSLQPSGGIRYSITGGLGLDTPMALLSGNSVGRQYDPCTGTTSVHRTVYVPGAKKADFSCSDGGKRCTSTIPTEPMSFPMMFSYTGTTSGSRIEGKTTKSLGAMGGALLSTLALQLEEMARMMPPELRQQFLDEARKAQKESSRLQADKPDPAAQKGETKGTIDASWSIGKNDPCDDVIDQLRQELSMIQAYADPNLLRQAHREGWSGEKYDDEVFKNGISKYASGWWKPGSSGSQSGYSGKLPDGDRSKHMDMKLDNKRCEILGQEEKRRAVEKDCIPKIVYDSILAHERTHAKQCMSEKTGAEFTSRTPASFQKFELEAYCVGAKKLMNWAQGVCKEADLKPLRDAYRSFCPK